MSTNYPEIQPESSPAAPGETNPPPFSTMDGAVLDEMLADLGEGSEDLIIGLINTYLTHTPTIFADMDKALVENDLVTLHRAAHTLKSSSASLGVMQLSELSKQMEAQLKPLLNAPLNNSELEKITNINHQVALLKTIFQQARTSLIAYQLKLQNRPQE
jgi:HPt (histidine-containing phosphotransfer) domain-containing protein